MKKIALVLGLASGFATGSFIVPTVAKAGDIYSQKPQLDQPPDSEGQAGNEEFPVMTNSIGMKLVRIPQGEFRMGSAESRDEGPVHNVRITRPFLLGQTEVTQAQWKSVMNTTPWVGQRIGESWMNKKRWKKIPEGPNFPALCISRDDAIKFCYELTQRERRRGRSEWYTLPTEAQWEYACRAGSSSRYCFGDDELRLKDFGVAEQDTPAPVGLKRANKWGLFDMHGNAAEWCRDRYKSDYYSSEQADDPQGPVGGPGLQLYSLRGGSFANVAFSCRSSQRLKAPGSTTNYMAGFRVSCVVD